jgi:hypothetical protein
LRIRHDRRETASQDALILLADRLGSALMQISYLIDGLIVGRSAAWRVAAIAAASPVAFLAADS